jgi:tRNA dimethylallyltransferase
VKGYRPEELRSTLMTPEANPTDPLAILLLGPTGSGKTALSLALGERFRGEVVSCDSVAVYRGMELGSAKPSLAERARLPHHLIDVADPDQPYTAGAYSSDARAALREVAARQHLPIVTGGTGLYLRALTDGLFDGPQRDDALRERLKKSAPKHPEAWLHRILKKLDPASAERIHPNDEPKLIRAIEICLTTQQPMSQSMGDEKKDPLTGFRLLRIGLNPPRQALYERLNQRCAQMFSDGLIAETQGLMERYGRVKALDALGYRQALMALHGEISEAEAIALAQQGHRNYAKRQLTWFRREPEVRWIEDFGNTPAAFEQASAWVQALLAKTPHSTGTML